MERANLRLCKGGQSGMRTLTRYNEAMAPIKVRGRFATAHDTARALGVSPARTRELIDTARALTTRMVEQDSRSAQSRNGRRTSASRKNVGAPYRKVRKSSR